MNTPIFHKTVSCVRPYHGKQNPKVVDVMVWKAKAHGHRFLKGMGHSWGRDHFAYFIPVPDLSKDNLGAMHFLSGHLTLEVLAHECVHAGHAFANAHAFQEIQHCPYHIGQDREECVAYVAGHLTLKLFKLFSVDLKTEMLLREDHL